VQSSYDENFFKIPGTSGQFLAGQPIVVCALIAGLGIMKKAGMKVLHSQSQLILRWLMLVSTAL
jgi:hypothetical protein